MNHNNGVIKVEAITACNNNGEMSVTLCVQAAAELQRQLNWKDIDTHILDPLLLGNAWRQDLADVESRPENTVSVNVAMSADMTRLKAELGGVAEALERAKDINEDLFSAKQAVEHNILNALEMAGLRPVNGSLEPDAVETDLARAFQIICNSPKLSGDLATLTARCEQQAEQIASLQDEIIALKTKTVMETPIPEACQATITITAPLTGDHDPDKVAQVFAEELAAKLPSEPVAPAPVNILDVEIPASPEENFKSNALRDVMQIKGDLRKEVCASALECFHKHEDAAREFKLRQWFGVQIKMAIADLLKIDTDLAGELMNEALKTEKEKALADAAPPPPSSTMAQFDAAYKASNYKTDRQKIVDALITICAQGGNVSKSGVADVARVLSACTLNKDAWNSVLAGTPGQTVLDKLLPALVAVKKVKLAT